MNVLFVIYCISFITQDLNALSLERKFISQADQQYVYMQWEKCIPNEFYRFICQNISFIALNQLHVTHGRANDIVREFVSVKCCSSFVGYFEEYEFAQQYVYSMLFPKFVMLYQKFGVEIRSNFMIYCKNWIETKRKRSTATANNETNNAGKKLGRL